MLGFQCWQGFDSSLQFCLFALDVSAIVVLLLGLLGCAILVRLNLVFQAQCVKIRLNALANHFSILVRHLDH